MRRCRACHGWSQLFICGAVHTPVSPSPTPAICAWQSQSFAGSMPAHVVRTASWFFKPSGKGPGRQGLNMPYPKDRPHPPANPRAPADSARRNCLRFIRRSKPSFEHESSTPGEELLQDEAPTSSQMRYDGAGVRWHSSRLGPAIRCERSALERQPNGRDLTAKARPAKSKSKGHEKVGANHEGHEAQEHKNPNPSCSPSKIWLGGGLSPSDLWESRNHYTSSSSRHGLRDPG
jgi:hypothetical protein